MALPICNNLTITGIRRTSSSETARILVEAYQNISEGEIDRVDFSISVNGGGASTTSVSTRAMWTPNDTDYDDPLPGSWGGGPAPSWCYGIELSMADYAAGYITITPIVYNTLGGSVTLDSIIVYNDKDGTDRRPTSAVIYWDWNNGSDSNTGLSSGNAVKTFQKACQLGAVSNDCGGLTILIDTAGTHTLQSSNSYSYGANLFTGGHHWIQVKPKTGLSRSDVKVKTSSSFDGDWMTFTGTSTNQSVRLRFSDIVILSPGILISSGSNVTAYLWVEHVFFTAPAPYDATFPYSEGMDIRVFDTRGTPTSINNLGTYGRRFATSTYAEYVITPKIGEMVRGCVIKKVAGQALQISKSNEHYHNILIDSIYATYGVSGYFPLLTGTFSVTSEPGGTNWYRVGATTSYVGADIAENAYYFQNSTTMGYKFAGFSNGGNNDTFYVVSGGYNGSNPYVVVSGSLTAEGAATVTIQPARVSTDEPWETLVHSDVVQFVASNLSNIIISSVAAFKAYETQGIYSAGHALSGVAIVNFYDGFINESYSLPNRTYIVGADSKHLLVRDATFARMEVDSTYSHTYSEVVGCVFSGFGAYAGSTTTFATQAYMNKNHFMTVADAVGNNTSTGPFYNSTTPSLSYDATASVSSTAYGTNSTEWSRPSAWFNNNKGAWDNVALADWSYSVSSTSVSITGSLSDTSSITTPNYLIGVNKFLTGTTTLSPYSKTITVFQTPVTSSSNISTATPKLSVGIPNLSASSALSGVGRTITKNTSLTSSASLTPVSTTTYNSESVISNIITISSASPTVHIGTSALLTGSSSTISTYSASVIVTTTQVPTTHDLPTVTNPPSYRSSTVGYTFLSTTEPIISDSEVLPILAELKQVKFNIGKLSPESKAAWTQNIIDAEDRRNTNKNVLNILTYNYKDFNKALNNPASRSTRQRF